jgi:hypothetical protein
MLQSLRVIGLGLVCSISMWSVSSADEIPMPTGEVLLTVTGDIPQTNVGDTLQFDFTTLSALDKTIVETSTIWTEGTHKFEGVSLNAFMELIGSENNNTVFLATAINDYTVEIPASDAVEGGPIIAYIMDGNEMSVRDKGPLWIIYPYDSKADYRSELVYSRSIWQLDRISVVK